LHACRSTLEDPLPWPVLPASGAEDDVQMKRRQLQLAQPLPVQLPLKLPGEPLHSQPDDQLGEIFRVRGTELEFVIMVIAVSCVKLLSAHNSTQHTSRKHKV
jgi:hypothetical protein